MGRSFWNRVIYDHLYSIRMNSQRTARTIAQLKLLVWLHLWDKNVNKTVYWAADSAAAHCVYWWWMPRCMSHRINSINRFVSIATWKFVWNFDNPISSKNPWSSYCYIRIHMPQLQCRSVYSVYSVYSMAQISWKILSLLWRAFTVCVCVWVEVNYKEWIELRLIINNYTEFNSKSNISHLNFRWIDLLRVNENGVEILMIHTKMEDTFHLTKLMHYSHECCIFKWN